MKWLVIFLFGVPSAYAGGITPSFSTGQMESAVLARLLLWKPLLRKIIGQDILTVCKDIIYKLKMELLYRLTQAIQIRKQLMGFRLNG